MADIRGGMPFAQDLSPNERQLKSKKGIRH